MANKRHKPEEIVQKLRQVDVLVGQGMARVDAVREVRITEQTYYRWRKQYGGMGSSRPPSVKSGRAKVDDFFAARSRLIPPLPWPTFSPPLSHIRFGEGRAARVVRVEHLGDQTRVHLDLGGHMLVTLADPHTSLKADDAVAVAPHAPLYFDAAGNRIS